MEDQLAVSTGYGLSRSHFLGQTSHNRWRQIQVNLVLDSYQEVKKSMTEGGIKMVYEYLKDGHWIHDGTRAEEHITYQHFMGDGNEMPSLFYPEFFVMQAIFGRRVDQALKPLKTVSKKMSDHWGVDITPGRPFYPCLLNSNKEQLLMIGNYQVQRNQLRHAQQRIASLERQVQEKNNQLKASENQLQNAKHQDERMRSYIIHLHQINVDIRELDKKRKIKSVLRNRCIQSMYELSMEGMNEGTKRAADEIPDGEEPKRHRQV